MQLLLPVKPRPKRPTLVTLLAVAVLLLSAANGGQAAVTLARWPALTALDLSIPLGLLVGSGFVWGAVWLAASAGLWLGYPPARIAALLLVVLYPISTLVLRAIFIRGGYERGGLVFEAVGWAILAGLTAVLLTRSRIRAWFERPFEEPPNDR